MIGPAALAPLPNHEEPLIRRVMPELDSMRGVAILWVFLYHALFVVGDIAAPGPILKSLFVLSRSGWLGVDLFFVLSGFLITGILLDSAQRPAGAYFKNFYARRALRILPLYYLGLIFFSVVLWGRGKVSLGFVSLSLVYLSNLAIVLGYAAAPALQVLWSLSVEEHFYLAWPMLVRAFRRWHLVALLVAVALLEPAVRALGVAVWGVSQTHLSVATWFRLDGLVMGAALALAVRAPSMTRRRFSRIGTGSILVAALIFGAGLPFGILSRKVPLGAALQYSCASLLFAGLLALVVCAGSGRFSRWVQIRPLMAAGRISYCMYLVHVFIIQSFDRAVLTMGSHPGTFLHLPLLSVAVRLLLLLLVTILTSELSFRFYERPFLERKRFFT
ncbi:MAG: hypothetical protein B7X11_01685 [Acidobacteria bacterium 37-65-4]|nr:MAG: hypothetical protein B7X11_01685 [Acidobacteria bacterium 37-65-4]